MDAYSIDKRVCINAVGLSGVDRRSAGSQGSATDHSGGRQLSFQFNLGQGYSAGNSAGFFQSIDEEPHH